MKLLYFVLILTIVQFTLGFKIESASDAASVIKTPAPGFINSYSNSLTEVSDATIQDIDIVTKKTPAAPVLVLYPNQHDCEWRTTNYFEQTLNTYTACYEVGEQEHWLVNDVYDVKKHGAHLCDQIQADENLKPGNFSIVAFSHGGMLARYLVEYCSFPQPIRHLVTFGSPMNGISGISHFQRNSMFGRIVNTAIDYLVDFGIMENIMVGTDYWRDPCHHSHYLTHSKFLAEANNEVGFSEERRSKWLSLTKTLYIQWENDEDIVPKESSHWAELDADFNVVHRKDTELYKSDLIGLKTMEENGQSSYINFPGAHMEFNYTQINDYVLPILRA